MKQKKWPLISLTFILIINISYAQTLKDLLWESVKPCYSELTENFEIKKEQIMDGEIIDDSKNGYLKVSGTFPTCGCPCTTISGAYKQANGKYTILTKQEWDCTWHKKLSSNKELSTILPKEFGISSFIPDYKLINYNQKYAVFYIDIEIPRIGTDTRVSLSLIPNGIYKESETIVTYKYRENKNTKYIYGVSEIAKNIGSSNTLNLILNKEYEKIPAKDMNHIKNTINKNRKSGTSLIQSIDDLNEQLTNLHQIYSLYKLMKYETIVLGWNKSNSRFYIKEKITNLKGTISFKEFIITKLKSWGALC